LVHLANLFTNSETAYIIGHCVRNTAGPHVSTAMQFGGSNRLESPCPNRTYVKIFVSTFLLGPYPTCTLSSHFSPDLLQQGSSTCFPCRISSLHPDSFISLYPLPNKRNNQAWCMEHRGRLASVKNQEPRCWQSGGSIPVSEYNGLHHVVGALSFFLPFLGPWQ